MARPPLALAALLLLAPAAASAADIAFPVDACARFSCRELTRPEQAMLGRVMAKLMSLLPTPDPARYEQTGLKSAQGLGAVMVTDAMWQSSSFPANIVDPMALGFGKAGAFPRSFALVYSYSLKDEGERTRLGLGQRFHKGPDGELEAFDVRIEASAWAIPAPTEPGSKARGGDLWEKAFWGEEKGTSKLTLIVGPKAAKKEPPQGAPGERLAPIKAIRIDLQGPTSEVRALAKKVDRRALKAVLGPVEKVIE